jgi:hypothetical protein
VCYVLQDRWKGNIKMDRREIWYRNKNRIELVMVFFTPDSECNAPSQEVVGGWSAGVTLPDNWPHSLV